MAQSEHSAVAADPSTVAPEPGPEPLEERTRRPHPRPGAYVRVALVLAIVTLAEVALYYLELPRALLIALLLFFSAIKFALVALWFMHLRFDSPVYSRVFVGGFALAATVYIVVLLTFGVFS